MFDIVALYYGKDLESFHCPECVAIYHRRGGKWRLFYLLTQTPVWQRVLDMYSYFGVPDDDLVMSTYGEWNVHVPVLLNQNGDD